MNHCPKLAGRCTQPGVHHDHLGAMRQSQLHSTSGPLTLSCRLEHWAESQPIIGLYLDNSAVDLNARQAIRTAARLASLALRLLCLAVHLKAAERQPRRG